MEDTRAIESEVGDEVPAAVVAILSEESSHSLLGDSEVLEAATELWYLSGRQGREHRSQRMVDCMCKVYDDVLREHGVDSATIRRIRLSGRST